MYSGTALIQVVGQVYQAAAATPVVSTTMVAAGTGGLLQSPVPTHGLGYCTIAAAMSSETTSAFATTAFLLVASGIKNFKL